MRTEIKTQYQSPQPGLLYSAGDESFRVNLPNPIVRAAKCTTTPRRPSALRGLRVNDVFSSEIPLQRQSHIRLGSLGRPDDIFERLEVNRKLLFPPVQVALKPAADGKRERFIRRLVPVIRYPVWDRDQLPVSVQVVHQKVLPDECVHALPVTLAGEVPQLDEDASTEEVPFLVLNVDAGTGGPLTRTETVIGRGRQLEPKTVANLQRMVLFFVPAEPEASEQVRDTGFLLQRIGLRHIRIRRLARNDPRIVRHLEVHDVPNVNITEPEGGIGFDTERGGIVPLQEVGIQVRRLPREVIVLPRVNLLPDAVVGRFVVRVTHVDGE